MSRNLQPIPPPGDAPRTDWTLIAVTGGVAFALVCSVILLVQQVSGVLDAWFPSPDPTATQVAAVWAVRLPSQGDWYIARTITPPDAPTQRDQFNGVGLPAIENASEFDEHPVSYQTQFTVQLAYPVRYPARASTAVQTRMQSPGSLFAYLAALNTDYYALYDGAGRFMEVITGDVLAAYRSIMVQTWRHPPMLFSSPTPIAP
jgi:hypothetical protein